MPKPVEVTGSAVREAGASYRRYAMEDIEVAARFFAELRNGLSRIGQLPASFPPYMGGTRRCMLRVFPYFIIFRDTPEKVQVVAIAHERRQPGYWMRRR